MLTKRFLLTDLLMGILFALVAIPTFGPAGILVPIAVMVLGPILYRLSENGQTKVQEMTTEVEPKKRR